MSEYDQCVYTHDISDEEKDVEIFEHMDGEEWSCQHPAGEDSRYCPFHQPVEEKEDQAVVERFLEVVNTGYDGVNLPPQERFRFIGAEFGDFSLPLFTTLATSEQFNPAAAEYPLDMREIHIEGALHWSQTTIRHGLLFDGASVGGEMDFSEATIEGECSFTDGQFSSLVRFDDIDISGSLSLDHAEFGLAVTMARALVDKTVTLDQSHVHAPEKADERLESEDFSSGDVYGVESQIGDNADFNKAVIGKSVRFNSADVGDSVRFINATIDKSVYFERSTIGGSAWCRNVDIGGTVRFEEASIEKSVMFEEAEINGSAKFKKSKLGGEVMFEACCIGRWVDFVDADIQKSVEFNQADIERVASFKQAVIGDEVEFNEADIGAGVYFMNADIGESVHFNEASMEKSNFSLADIGKSVWFKGANIWGLASFTKINIGKYAKFKRANIKGPASFRGVSIGDTASFPEVRIGEWAKFNNSDIGGDVEFQEVTIKGDTEFNKVTIGRNGNFSKAELNGSAEFQDAEINGELQFTEANIDGVLNFECSEIGGDVKFTDATIDSTAWFNEVEIGESAQFDKVVMRGSLHFEMSAIGKSANFESAYIKGNSDFNEAEIGAQLEFEGAEIKGGAWFSEADIRGGMWFKEGDIDGSAKFINAEIGGMVQLVNATVETVSFRDAHFSCCTLSGDTTLSGNLGESPSLKAITVDGTLELNLTSDFDGLNVIDMSESEVHSLSLTEETSPIVLDLTNSTINRFDEQELLNSEILLNWSLQELDFSQFNFTESRDTLASIDWDFHSINRESRYALAREAVRERAADDAEELIHLLTLIPSLSRRISDGDTSVRDANALVTDAAEIVFTDEKRISKIVDGNLEDTDVTEDSAIRKYPLDEEWKYTPTVARAIRNLRETIKTDSDFVNALESDAVANHLETISRSVVEAKQDVGPEIEDAQKEQVDTDAIPTEDLEVTLGDSYANPEEFRAENNLEVWENTYLNAKVAANEQGLNELAAEFFVREKRFTRKRHAKRIREGDSIFERGKAAFEWASNLTMDMTTGYGERPRNVVVSSLVVVGLFAGIYRGLNALPSGGNLAEYLLFSLQNFVTFIIGTEPQGSLVIRYTTAIEAFLGSFFVALFVFTLTRSLNR